ncbi:hypothetical protein ACFFWA_02875 [Actinomadura verrucosospora]|uniref:hypothetical protein n=1 Tax=Actinomadura verrucosospora TaxID=46165 RepID=UPI0031EDF329
MEYGVQDAVSGGVSLVARKAVKAGIFLGVVGMVVAGGVYLAMPDDKPFTVYQYRQMCSKPRGFKQAAQRAAGGPRPILVYGQWPVPDSNPTKMDTAALKIWAPTDPSTVQLVACVDLVGQGDFVQRCDYQPDNSGMLGQPQANDRPFSYNLFKGRYAVTIYEALTGKLLTKTEVTGVDFRPDVPDGSAAEPCSPHAIADSTGEYKKVGEPTIADLRTVMDPYVLR